MAKTSMGGMRIRDRISLMGHTSTSSPCEAYLTMWAIESAMYPRLSCSGLPRMRSGRVCVSISITKASTYISLAPHWRRMGILTMVDTTRDPSPTIRVDVGVVFHSGSTAALEITDTSA